LAEIEREIIRKRVKKDGVKRECKSKRGDIGKKTMKVQGVFNKQIIHKASLL